MANVPILDKKNSAYFIDAFDDGTIGLKTRLGNGTIVESGGRLNFDAPEFAECGFFQGGIHAYTGLGAGRGPDVPEVGPLVVDLYCNEFNSTTNSCLSGLFVYYRDPEIWDGAAQNNDDTVLTGYSFGWYPNDSGVAVRRAFNSAWTTQANVTGRPRPSGSNPYIFRVIYNNLPTGVGGPWPFNAPTSYWYLQPGYVWFVFSTDDGATWTSLLSEKPPWDPADYGDLQSSEGYAQKTTRDRLTHAGPYLRKWATGAGETADSHFTKMEAGTLDQHAFQFLPDGPADFPSDGAESGPNLGQQQYGRTLAYDDVRIVGSKRAPAPDHITGVDHGQHIPGSPVSQEVLYETDSERYQARRAEVTGLDDAVVPFGVGAGRHGALSAKVGHPATGQQDKTEDDWGQLQDQGDGPARAHTERQKPVAGAQDAVDPWATKSAFIDGGLDQLLEEGDTNRRSTGRQGSGAVDELIYELGTADYQDGVIDGDGQEFLGGGDAVNLVRVIDTTQGGFGDPTNNNHWGAARDGKLYADGIECGSEGYDFGTLAGGKKRSAWRFTDAGQLMQREPYYHTTPSWYSEVLSADDELEITHTGIPSDWLPDITSHGKWYLPPGDFDVEIEFDEFTGTNEQNRIEFGVANSRNGNPAFTSVYMYIRQNTGVGYLASRQISGSYAELGRVTMSPIPSSGRMRITRTANVFQCYKWDAGDTGWVNVGTTYSHASLEDHLYVWMGYWCDGGDSGHCKLRNFTINAGTPTNRVSWYREATGDHRGTQPDMPNSVAILSTENSVDLIDTVNDRLWMRFVRATDYAFLDNGGNSIIRDLAWKDGILLLAVGRDTAESQEGNVIVIDFTMDIIRCHRESAASTCGAFFQDWWAHEPGHIANRNIGYGYANDNDTWHIQDYRTRTVAISHVGGYHYRAIGSVEGLNVFRWLRWKMNGEESGVNDDDWGMVRSTATETTEILRARFLDDELFYCDATTLYSRDRTNGGSTGWEDNIGGTFSAEHTKALPGTRAASNYGNYEPVFYKPAGTTYVFMPADQGVYRVDWPSGSWELFYGAGGTHDILGSYSLVRSIAFANDGVTDLLLVGLTDGALSRIVAVRLTDNTVYGTTPQVSDLRAPFALAG